MATGGSSMRVGDNNPEGRTGSPPQSIQLTDSDYLLLENCWLKIRLKRTELEMVERELDSARATVASRYKVSGSWTVDLESRCLVPAGSDSRVGSASEGATTAPDVVNDSRPGGA